MKDILQYVLPIMVHTARYFLFAGVPFLVFYILFPDVFSKNKIQSRFAKHKDFLREIAHSMQTVFILVLVGMLIMKTPLGNHTQVYEDISEYAWWWIPVSVLSALVLHDTYFYWMHRAVHHPKLYRRVHLLHHQSVNPSPWASYSFHILEAILEAMIAPLILFLIPMHPIALIFFASSSFLINVYGHLGYEIAPKWFRYSILFELLNTSTHHNLHHSKFKGNYGLYFRVWDRLMGTEHPDYVKEYDKIQERRFGECAPSTSSWRSNLSIFLLFAVGLPPMSAITSLQGIEGKWRYSVNFALLLFTSTGLLFGQECDNQRYYDEIFSVKVTSDIKFGENLQPTILDPNNIQELFMDIYQPDGDTLSARPLIIWAFGGGFIFGSKTSPDIVALSNAFAKRGYVTAAMDYRLSTDLVINNEIENAYEAVAKAMHDMRASIRYFYKDAATANNFKIDTSRIYIGGVSAGAVAALHIVHLDESEIPAEMQAFFDENGGLSGNSGNEGYSEDVAGIISLCGMLLDVDLINPEVTTPIVSMHGTEDGIVPYGAGTITILDIGIEVDGSSVIHPRLDEYGIINDFYTWQGANHTPFVLNPPNEAELYMDTTILFVRDFLFDLVCDGVTSVNETSPSEGSDSSFQVFPNPNNGNFFIRSDSDEIVRVTVFDDLGRQVFSNPGSYRGLNGLELNLPKGMYTVHVYSNNGRTFLARKVVVH